MSNLTELLKELATVAPDVCGKGKFGRIKIGEYEFNTNEFYTVIDRKPVGGPPAEALLIDALAAECRRRRWRYTSGWSPAAGLFWAGVALEQKQDTILAHAFLAAFIAAYKSESPAAQQAT